HSMPEDMKYELQRFQNDEPPKKDKLPYTWWDWQFMIQEIESGRAERAKFVPAGFGNYSSASEYVPAFVKGAAYYNLASEDEFASLLRSLQTQFRARNPRQGVFISYSHKDQHWFDLVHKRLQLLEQRGVRIWTDQSIEPGEKWDVAIQDALA